MERTPPGKKGSEKGKKLGEDMEMRREEGIMIGILKEIKEDMANMRKEIREEKEKWELRMERMEARMKEMEERMKEMEGRREEERKEKEWTVEEIVDKVVERDKENRGMEEKREERKEERDELEIEVRRLKRIVEEKDKKERRNNIVIRGLSKNATTRSIRDMGREWLEQEFEVKEKIKNVQSMGREGKEVVIIELEDWRSKEKIMREKNKLRGKNVYIDHDMTREEREVQRKIRMRAREEKAKGNIVKAGYRKIYINEKQWAWSEKEGELRERTNL